MKPIRHEVNTIIFIYLIRNSLFSYKMKIKKIFFTKNLTQIFIIKNHCYIIMDSKINLSTKFTT